MLLSEVVVEQVCMSFSWLLEVMLPTAVLLWCNPEMPGLDCHNIQLLGPMQLSIQYIEPGSCEPFLQPSS